MLWRCNPNAQLRSIARTGGIVPDSAAGMSTAASICFTTRRAVGRMDAEGGSHPDGEYVAASLSILRGEFGRCADVGDSDGLHCG